MDGSFKNNNDIIPAESRSMVRGWGRPSKGSYVFNNDPNTSMCVRQGMIGDCYLISAIGVLGKDRLRSIISEPKDCPPGCYMVKFNKFNQ
jgi:hypothetical protein